MAHLLWQPCRNGLALAWWIWNTGSGLAKFRLLSELLWQTSAVTYRLGSWNIHTLKYTSARMYGCICTSKTTYMLFYTCAIQWPLVKIRMTNQAPFPARWQGDQSVIPIWIIHNCFIPKDLPRDPAILPIPPFRCLVQFWPIANVQSNAMLASLTSQASSFL